MAGTITGSNPIGTLGQAPSFIYDAECTFDASGNLSGVPIEVHSGYLMAIDTIPNGTTPPASGYSLSLLDANGVDVLAGDGAARSSTAKERIIIAASPVPSSYLYPTVASGGANGKIRIILWIQGA